VLRKAVIRKIIAGTSWHYWIYISTMKMRKTNKSAAVLLKLALGGLIILASTKIVSAATVDWKGATSTDWGTGSNWSTGSTPASGDAVRIGVVSFTNQPTLKSGATTTIASLTFGTLSNITLTVNSGYTLAVTGAIVQNSNNAGNILTTLTGAGALTCASLQVGNTNVFPPVLAVDLTEVISTISSFHITGNVTVNSTDFGVLIVGVGFINATFSLEGGTTTIDGTLLTTNTNSGVLSLVYATPKFSVDITTSASPVLNLTNASAINTSSVAGTIDFYNNNGGTGTSTVYYNGTTQEVYANTTAALDNNPQTYQYLQLTGAGTKTVDAGTLTVGSDLTSSATAVALNTNNPAVTVGGSWTNSSSVTQGSGNITVTGSVTNNTGGTLTLGSGNLYIATNYTNNTGGVYSQSSGTTYFNGSGAQALVDNSTTGTTFKLVDFSGGGTSTMSAGTNNVNFAVASTGVLTMSNSSKLVAGTSSAAYLTLKSDTNGAATVANIPSGCSITGYVTVQRFVQGSATYDNTTGRWIARNYRLMSSPVDEGVDGSGNYPYSLNYLGASTIITDCTSTYATKSGNPSLYLFDEHYTPSNATFTSGNFIGVTNISNTSASGTITTTDATYGSAKVYAGDGFMMYFRGDNITHLTGSPNKTTYPYVAPESVTFSTTGNLNQGTYSVVSWTGSSGLLYSTTNAGNATIRGFNLVGNPYASSIDWSTFSNSNSSAAIYGYKVNPTVYVFDPITSNYDTYNATTGIATGKASKIIPSGQGFFVLANAASPTLTFNESAKTNTQVTGSNLLMGAPAAQTAYNSYLRLKVSADSINYDDVVIGFSASSTTKYDSNVDSKFFPGWGNEVSVAAISSDSIKVSVKWEPFPKISATRIIKLYVSAKAGGQYTLQRTDLQAIPAIYDVWLMDNYLRDSLDIKHNTAYIFNVNLSDTASYGNNRFTIVVRQDPALAVHLLSFSAVKAQTGSQITWATENEANYTNFTVQRSVDGGTTFSVLGGVNSSGQGTYTFLDKTPATGPNTYRLMIQDLNGAITYSSSVTLVYGNVSLASNGNIDIYPNPATSVINLSISQQAGKAAPVLIAAGQSALQSISLTPSLVTSANANTSSFDIKIVNITGVVVRESTSSSSNWQSDVSGLLPGTYIIQVQDKTSSSLVGRGMFVKM